MGSRDATTWYYTVQNAANARLSGEGAEEGHLNLFFHFLQKAQKRTDRHVPNLSFFGVSRHDDSIADF